MNKIKALLNSIQKFFKNLFNPSPRVVIFGHRTPPGFLPYENTSHSAEQNRIRILKAIRRGCVTRKQICKELGIEDSIIHGHLVNMAQEDIVILRGGKWILRHFDEGQG